MNYNSLVVKVCKSHCFERFVNNFRTYVGAAVILQVSVHMVTDEGIDWWSKYYASIGNMDKCWHYVELGYDKLQACHKFIVNIFIVIMK